MDDRAFVVGGGSGRLATGIALQQTGGEVKVLARAAELWEIAVAVAASTLEPIVGQVPRPVPTPEAT
jgi:2-polyprenyl-6-methoxyphenol hydroxylase-like FAD-dependent oxidoreductase